MTTVLYLLSIIAVVFHTAHYYPMLPDVMASNFGAGGVPHAWMSKHTILLLNGGIFCFIHFCLFILPRVAPDRTKVRVPNADYHLHPDRKQATIAWMRGFLDLIGTFICLCYLAIGQLVIRANLSGGNLDNGMFIGVLGFIVAFMIASFVTITIRFKRATVV